MAMRSDRESLFTIGVLSNLPLLGAVLLGAAAADGDLRPGAEPILKTQPLTAGELALCVLLPSLVFVAIEIEKVAIRRGWLYRDRPRTALSDREPGVQSAATGLQNSRSGRS